MMFKDDFGLENESLLIKNIIGKLLEKKVVNQDLVETDSYTTSEVGDWISNEIMKY